MSKKLEIRVRDAEQVERLAAALVKEEVAFSVKPEPDSWWRIRADMVDWLDLQAIEQQTRMPR